MGDIAKSMKMSSGYEMPKVALGTWTMWNVSRNCKLAV